MRNIIIGTVILAAVSYSFFKNVDMRADSPIAIPDALPGAKPSAPRPVQENVVAYHTGDAVMNAAKRRARETLPRFHELIDGNAPGTYAIKFPLTQNDATEHIWLQITNYENGTFHGLLADVPVNGTKYHIGQKMDVLEDKVEDWMVRSDDLIYGGYTARVALADMPKEEAEKYRLMFRD